MCRPIIQGNPFVDEIWEVAVAGHHEMIAAWERFRGEARLRTERGDFDQVFLTQIYPDNFGNYDGTVRASIFRGYPRPLTVPVTPIIRLSDLDVQRVQAFADEHALARYRHVILFEFGSHSGQSFLTPEFAHAVAEAIVARRDDAAVILSSHTPAHAYRPQIIDGSTLPFHVNAELSKYCHLLIGCSSGISWLCTSDWAKHLPTIQLLRQDTSVYASMVHDHEHFGLPTDSIIEMTDCSPQKVAECAVAILQGGFPSARAQFHETIPLRFGFYAQTLQFAWDRGGFRTVARSLLNTLRRYGPRLRLLAAIAQLSAKRAVSRIAQRIPSRIRLMSIRHNKPRLQHGSRLRRLASRLSVRLVGRESLRKLRVNLETLQNDRAVLLRKIAELRNQLDALQSDRAVLPQGLPELKPMDSGTARAEQLSNVAASPRAAELVRVSPHYPFPRLGGVDPDCLRVSIVDVGAEALEFESDVYEPLLTEGRCEVIGFDPFIDPSVSAVREAPLIGSGSTGPNPKRILPYFIGNGARCVFHVNRFIPTSSLFPLNMALARQFLHLTEMCETVRTLEVETRRLDDIPEIERCDFLKVDVQGSDYDVVVHASRILERTIFVHIEAEFAPLYSGQPLFVDIDRFMRSHGFELIDLVKLGWNNYRALPSTIFKSRLLWSDCIYMKEVDRLAALDPRLLIRAAYIAHVNYRKYDLAAHLLKSFDERANTSHCPVYAESLATSSEVE